MKRILFIFLFFSSITTCIISWLLNNDSQYILMPFLPISYLMVYILFLNRAIFEYKSIVAVIFSILSFFRYIILPLCITLTNSYGINYINIANDSYYHNGFMLMIYEIVVICIVIYLYTSKQKNKFKNYRSNLKLTGSIYIYILLIMVAFLLYIIYPGANNLLSFFNIESTGSSRIEEDLSTTAMIVRQILISATIFGYVLCLNYLYSEYKRNNSVIYVYASIFISLIQVSIIIGERRSFQLYTTFAVLFLLLTLYKKHKKKIAIWVLVTAGTVLIGMSIYKFFYAFEYDSYIEAIMKSNSQSSDIANYLQLYLLGPQNIAKSIEFTANISPSISNLFYDVSRSILGISFLVKDIGMPTSTNLFNTYIYGGLTSTGHIISSIGYGYMYFGYILAPFFSATIIVFALFIETKLKNTSSFEYAYLLAYILIRSILGVFTAITALLNVVSLMLISVGLVYFSARVTKVLLLKQRNNNWRIRRENIYD